MMLSLPFGSAQGARGRYRSLGGLEGHGLCPWRLRRYVLPLLALLTIIVPLPALALPEGELPSAFETEVRPFLAGQVSYGSFSGSGGLRLHYAKREVPSPRAIVVLVNGRTEFVDKYAELLYDLRDLPLSTYLFDHRGQGGSGRLLPKSDKGHVDSFQDYVDDLTLFVDTVVRPAPGQPLVLLSHSMGGTVAALFANRHPHRLQGLILSAPMLGLRTPPLPLPLARLLAWGASHLGLATSYLPGGGPYQAGKPFSANVVTTSPARFALNQGLVAASPSLALGSPTYGWLQQAFVGMDRINGDHHGLTMPVLLLQAGADTVVDNRAQTDFCAALPDCSLVVIPGARHEILMEGDALRDLALEKIRLFLTSRLARQGPSVQEAKP